MTPELGFEPLTFGKPVGRSPHSSTERSLKVFSFSKQNLTDLSILRCNKLSTNISSGWLAFYDLGTKKSFKKLGKFMALVTFEVTNWWSTLIQQHYQLRKFPLKNAEYSIQICPLNILNTSCLTDSYIGLTLKMESVSKNTILGLKMMVKSGLEKVILKFLNEGR